MPNQAPQATNGSSRKVLVQDVGVQTFSFLQDEDDSQGNVISPIIKCP